MKQFKKLSETEMEIMEVLWNLEEPISTADLLSFFIDKRQKEWKLQTISTFLTRLNEKGLVAIKRKGRSYLYSAALTPQQYRQAQAKSILDILYNGSVKNFLSALYTDKKAVSTDEISELKKWLSEK